VERELFKKQLEHFFAEWTNNSKKEVRLTQCISHCVYDDSGGWTGRVKLELEFEAPKIPLS
jgi:hypothetical protein